MKDRLSSVAYLVLATLLLIVSPSPPGQAVDERPVIGVHTIRTDDRLLQMANFAGFKWVIQLLEWREIEPAPGEAFWEYPDWLVRAAEYYGLDLVLRVDHPPQWAVSGQDSEFVDVAAYARFVQRVAERYRGRVMAYVVWNEPNLSSEWGDQPPDPDAYVELLCSAQAAIHSADPDALVVSAGLAPTNHADDSALDDRLYLRAMYGAGATACFDVLGAHPYGFAYPPDDPHGNHNGLNFARLADLRAIMVEADDSNKAVWATETGWTTEAATPEQKWLRISEAQQGRYLVEALQSSSRDWPWLERIAIWNLSLGLPPDDEKRGYSILASDGRPKAAFQALAAVARRQGRTAVLEEGNGEASEQTVEILAPDVIVRLSDVDTIYPHWTRPYCISVPCRQWYGEFYVRDPGISSWQLRLEIMQVEEPGNSVWINGNLLNPPAIPLPGRPDFASVWTAVEMPVATGMLQPGVNTIEVRSSPRLPVYQDTNARYESLQLRHVRLEAQFMQHP
jgi:hypothetical protein